MRNKKIASFIFILFVCSILLYALYTGRHMLQGPHITLVQHNATYESSEEFTLVQGTVVNTTRITINEAPLSITKNGTFSKRVLLYTGDNTFILEATDRFGRTSQETLIIRYAPNDTLESDFEMKKKMIQ